MLATGGGEAVRDHEQMGAVEDEARGGRFRGVSVADGPVCEVGGLDGSMGEDLSRLDRGSLDDVGFSRGGCVDPRRYEPAGLGLKRRVHRFGERPHISRRRDCRSVPTWHGRLGPIGRLRALGLRRPGCHVSSVSGAIAVDNALNNTRPGGGAGRAGDRLVFGEPDLLVVAWSDRVGGVGWRDGRAPDPQAEVGVAREPVPSEKPELRSLGASGLLGPPALQQSETLLGFGPHSRGVERFDLVDRLAPERVAAGEAGAPTTTIVGRRGCLTRFAIFVQGGLHLSSIGRLANELRAADTIIVGVGELTSFGTAELDTDGRGSAAIRFAGPASRRSGS